MAQQLDPLIKKTETIDQSHAPAIAHDHASCVGAAIEEAERLCHARGSRFTPLRRRVLELVWQGHRAVKAYDILAALGSENLSAKPPTVYRALDFLMQEGFVHKIESLNAYIGCPHPANGHKGRFMICRACETVIEIGASDLDNQLMLLAEKRDFQIKSQIIEIHGFCAFCRQTGLKKSL